MTERRPTAGLTAAIAAELHLALERLGADPSLLAIVARWQDGMDDAAVLAMLREFNTTGRVLRRPQ